MRLKRRGRTNMPQISKNKLELSVAEEIILALDMIREFSSDEAYILCNANLKRLNKEFFNEVLDSLVIGDYVTATAVSERGKPLYSLTEKGYKLLESPEYYTN